MGENLWANIVKNWRSSGSAVIASIAGLVAIFYPDKTSLINQVAAAVGMLFLAIMGLVGKDSSVTGTAANPRAKNAGEPDPGPIVPKV